MISFLLLYYSFYFFNCVERYDIDYYSLRFQLEFNFRYSKQYFGLEDFMNIQKRRLHNFANLSLFMAERYARETLKFYGQKVNDILMSKAIKHIAQFSMIYRDSA